MNNRDNPKLNQARKLAAALRAAKTGHAWTARECGLLANLCTELGVDAPEHAQIVKEGELLAGVPLAITLSLYEACTHPSRQPHGRHETYVSIDPSGNGDIYMCRACGATATEPRRIKK